MAAGCLDLDQQVGTADIGEQEHGRHRGANELQQLAAYFDQVFRPSDIEFVGKTIEAEAGARCLAVGLHDDGCNILEGFSCLRRHVAGMQGLDAPVGAMDQYNAACTLARAGDTAGALEAIERCADLVAAGKVDSRAAITRRMFETDPDLLSIRAEERFVKATAKAFPESAAQKDGGSSRRGS